MVDRIKQIIEFYKLSPASFAEQIGINRSNLTHLFSGRNQPSLELVKKILTCFPEVKTEWLIMGVGEMLRNSNDKELEAKIQNGKKRQSEYSELDLFENLPTQNDTLKMNTAGETDIHKKNEIVGEIFNSREVKNEAPQSVLPHEKDSPLPTPIISVIKIVFFYSDNSFEIFHSNR